MKKHARQMALSLMLDGADQRRWTPELRRAWKAAVNALQRLSGHKIRL